MPPRLPVSDRRLDRDRGATAIEYALYVALVALALFLAVTFFTAAMGATMTGVASNPVIGASSTGGDLDKDGILDEDDPDIDGDGDLNENDPDPRDRNVTFGGTPPQGDLDGDGILDDVDPDIDGDGDLNETDPDPRDGDVKSGGGGDDTSAPAASPTPTPTPTPTPSPSVSAPSEPQSVAAAASRATLTVTWDAPRSDGGAPISGYSVEVGRSASCTADFRGDVSRGVSDGREAIFGSLPAGAYCVKVRAANEAGQTSGWRTAGTFTVAGPATPGAPTGVRAIRTGDGEVTVSWTAPADDGGSAIEEYPIGYEDDGISSSTVCGAGSGSYSDESDTGAASDTSETEDDLGSRWYCVRIAAENDASGSLNYAYAGPVFSGVSKPGAPRNVAGSSASEGQVTVTWDAPASDGGQAITGYTVEYENDDIGSSTTCGASLSYNDGKDSVGAGERRASESGLGDKRVCVRVSASNGVTAGTTEYAYVKVDARDKD